MKSGERADLQAADVLYRAGKFDEAEMIYRAAETERPKNSHVLEQLGTIALWQNRPETAIDYFEKARRHMPAFKNFWPLNTQLEYRLGSAFYRQGCFAQAEAHFRRAAGPIALGPFRELKSMAQQMALFADDTPYAIAGPEESRIKFVVTDPLPVVEVRINGCRPCYFFIDTGGAEIILDRQLAREVGAEIVGGFSASYAGQKQAETGLGKIDSIQIGEMLMRHVPIHTLDVAAMSSVFDGLEIRGIIGTRYLMQFLSTLDYANEALVLQRLTPTTTHNLEAQIVADGLKVIPCWLIETHYIVAWGTVNGRGPQLFLVDTGLAGNGFTAPEPMLHEAGIRVDWTQAREGPGGGGKTKATPFVVERLTLGTGVNEVVETNVPGVAIENSAAVLKGQLGFRVDGLISHQFFRRHAVTFDFAGMRLIVRSELNSHRMA